MVGSAVSDSISDSSAPSSVARGSSRRFWWPLVKWSLFLLVLAAVGWHGWRLWREIDFREVQLRPLWFLPAILAYIAGWLPAVWYWRSLMAGAGERVGWSAAARAYFCGHLGKYVPGKAGVVLIRAGMLQQVGCRAGAAAVTSIYETLATMAAGALVAVLLLPALVREETLSRWFAQLPQGETIRSLLPGLAIAACLLGLPLMSRVLNELMARLMRRRGADLTAEPIVLRPMLLAFLPLIAGWWLHGLSLGLTIQSVSSEAIVWSDWPRWTGAVSLATVLGFVAIFAPGGAGVREGVLMEALEPAIGSHAVLAAGLLRIVWLAGEILAAVTLYYGFRPLRKDSTS